MHKHTVKITHELKGCKNHICITKKIESETVQEFQKKLSTIISVYLRPNGYNCFEIEPEKKK